VIERSNELVRQRRDAENADLLQAALERFPDAPHVRLHAAAAAVAGQDPEAAETLLRGAVCIAPDDPAVLTHAAFLAFDLDRYGKAETWIRRAVAIAPSDFVLAGSVAHLVGKLALVRGELDLAEQMLRLGFELEPTMFGHGMLLGALLEHRGRVAEALGVLEEAVRHRPDDEALKKAREGILNHP
jgi:Flp pilus assembly protein TadD